MLPDNRLSDIAVMSEMLYQFPTAYHPLIDYEMGGIALGDTSYGLETDLWRLAYDDKTGNLFINKIGGDKQLLLNQLGISKVSLAFDVNMRPAYALEIGDNVELTYYDTALEQQVSMKIDNVHSPYVMLDERRYENIANADVLLFYIRERHLCMRLQRHRFLQEIILRTLDYDNAVIERVGIMTNLRVGFYISHMIQHTT